MDMKASVLHPQDNVATLLADVESGEVVRTRDAQVTAVEAVPFGHKIALCRIAQDGEIIKYGESIGKATLYVDEKIVAQGGMKTQPGKFTLSGDGLCVGRDSGDAVSEEYKSPGDFKGGKILFVGVTTEKQRYLDLEKLAAAAFAVD